jgi:hypothetical protein
MGMSYWLDLFTRETWEEFLAAGGRVSGFSKGRRGLVAQMKPGDVLVCYVTGVSRFIGVLDVQSDMYEDSSPIWSAASYPYRVKVKVRTTLTLDTSVPVSEVRDHLGMFTQLRDLSKWGVLFQSSAVRLSDSDGQALVVAVDQAARNPIHRSVEDKKPAHRRLIERNGQPITTEIGTERGNTTTALEFATVAPKEATAHTEIQWLLLKLGNDMDLDVWVARNDRGRTYNGRNFSDLPRMKQSLPIKFDDDTRKTIELIDVLWLKSNSIEAAFEIESTTSIYSGLLRMSDLIAMQPNLNILLYLVAPDERRRQVKFEVNRPTFARLTPPMSRICRLIPFSKLRDGLPDEKFFRRLKLDILEDLSESCAGESD